MKNCKNQPPAVIPKSPPAGKVALKSAGCCGNMAQQANINHPSSNAHIIPPGMRAQDAAIQKKPI